MSTETATVVDRIRVTQQSVNPLTDELRALASWFDQRGRASDSDRVTDLRVRYTFASVNAMEVREELAWMIQQARLAG